MSLLPGPPASTAHDLRLPFPAWLVPGALSAAECAASVAQLEREGFSPTGAAYPPGYRDNDRAVFDHPALAEALLARLHAVLPSTLTDGAELLGLNPRFRACRYRGGQRFTMHRDGAWHPHAGARSRLTVMLYLNGPSASGEGPGFTGGDTVFSDRRVGGAELLRVPPRAGQAVIFDHRLWHEGAPVPSGTKWVLRTDALYAEPEPVQPGSHRGYVWSAAACEGGWLTGGRDGVVMSPAGALRGHAGSVTALAAEGERWWSGDRSGALVQWASSGAQERSWQAHEGAVLGLTVGPGGALLSCGADGAVRSWPEGRALCQHEGWAWGLAASARGVASVGVDGRVFVSVGALEGGALEGGAPEAWARGLPPLRGVTWSRGALFVVSEGGQLWRVPCDGDPQLIGEHRGGARALISSPDGALLTGGFDGRVLCWRGGVPTELAKHGDFVNDLACDGAQVLSVGHDGVRCAELAARPRKEERLGA